MAKAGGYLHDCLAARKRLLLIPHITLDVATGSTAVFAGGSALITMRRAFEGAMGGFAFVVY